MLLNQISKKWKTEKGSHYGKIFTGYAELCRGHENPGRKVLQNVMIEVGLTPILEHYYVLYFILFY